MVQETAEEQIVSSGDEKSVADEIDKEFNLGLPGQNLPTPLRLIAFFTLGGGVSIIGSLFVEDIISPRGEDMSFYVVRIIIGALALLIAYGMIERRRWAIWLYGGLAIMAIFTNPFVAIVPIGVVVYLYIKRQIFTPFILDIMLGKAIFYIKNLIIKRPPTTSLPV